MYYDYLFVSKQIVNPYDMFIFN